MATTKIGSSGVTFPDATTQSTAATGTVTSVATGNGLSGGTITTSGTLTVACPTFASVGSYCFGGALNQAMTAGSNYGSIQTTTLSMPASSNSGVGGDCTYGTVSGTWKCMGATWALPSTNYAGGTVMCRVS